VDFEGKCQLDFEKKTRAIHATRVDGALKRPKSVIFNKTKQPQVTAGKLARPLLLEKMAQKNFDTI
jgi:hypothetical protein